MRDIAEIVVFVRGLLRQILELTEQGRRRDLRRGRELRVPRETGPPLGLLRQEVGDGLIPGASPAEIDDSPAAGMEGPDAPSPGPWYLVDQQLEPIAAKDFPPFFPRQPYTISEPP